MAISIIDDRELWDSTVDQTPFGYMFHKWDFLKIARKRTGWMLLPYGVYKGQRLLSLFPLFYKRQVLIKSVFSPPPLSCIPYLGPTMNAGYEGLKPSTRESDLQAVVDEVTAAIKKLSPSYVYVQMPPGYNDIRPFTWNGFSEISHHTYFIDLKPPLEKILARFDKNLRWNSSRRSARCPSGWSGCTMRGRSATSVGKRYREKGLTFPITGPQYLKDLLDKFPENVQMYFLYHGEEIASVITVCRVQGPDDLLDGQRPAGQRHRGNDSMLWTRLLKKAKQEGCTEFDRGRRRPAPVALQVQVQPAARGLLRRLHEGLLTSARSMLRPLE